MITPQYFSQSERLCMRGTLDKKMPQTYFDCYLKQGKVEKITPSPKDAFLKIPMVVVEILLALFVMISSFITVNNLRWEE